MGKSIPNGGTSLQAIPRPPGLPVLGNVLAIDPENPMLSIVNFLNQYGPIVNLKFPKQSVIMVGSQELVHELCDQDRFQKTVSGALEEIRALAKDGELPLFSKPLDAPLHRLEMESYRVCRRTV